MQFVTGLALPVLKTRGQSGVSAGRSYLGAVFRSTLSDARPVYGRNVPENDREIVRYYRSIEFSALLPEFFYLSANVVDMLEQSPNESWMQLAAEFMLHIAATEFLDGGIPDDASAEEVFEAGLWRYYPGEIPGAQPSRLSQDELRLVNEMLRVKDSPPDKGQASSQLAGWEEILLDFQAYFARIYFPGLDSSLPQDLSFSALGRDYPVPDFTDKVLSYCESVLSFFGTPILVQLEKGQLDSLDLSPLETEELKERCGWK